MSDRDDVGQPSEATARVVYKYPLEVGVDAIAVRAGSRLLHFQTIRATPTVWVEQPLEAPSEREERWNMRVVATGQGFTLLDGEQHVGSSACPDTGLVWHLYRRVVTAEDGSEPPASGPCEEVDRG